MIVKDQLPYSPYIKKGHNCLAYKTGEELEKCFDIMVEGKQNDKLIDNAYEWVTNERDVLKIAPDLVKLYYSLLPEKTQEKIELV
jgi:hypothetical protein